MLYNLNHDTIKSAKLENAFKQIWKDRSEFEIHEDHVDSRGWFMMTEEGMSSNFGGISVHLIYFIPAKNYIEFFYAL